MEKQFQGLANASQLSQEGRLMLENEKNEWYNLLRMNMLASEVMMVTREVIDPMYRSVVEASVGFYLHPYLFDFSKSYLYSLHNENGVLYGYQSRIDKCRAKIDENIHRLSQPPSRHESPTLSDESSDSIQQNKGPNEKSHVQLSTTVLGQKRLRTCDDKNSTFEATAEARPGLRRSSRLK